VFSQPQTPIPYHPSDPTFSLGLRAVEDQKPGISETVVILAKSCVLKQLRAEAGNLLE
jgi:hypothetical protein